MTAPPDHTRLNPNQSSRAQSSPAASTAAASTAAASTPAGSNPAEPNAAAAQAAIADEFALFGDWTERYQYLIDLGRKLPPFPDAARSEANKVHGCQSQVWLEASGDATRLDFRATSDSSIVSGLIALLLRVYSARSASDILDTEPVFIDAIGLARHLSPTRSNGLAAMLATIKRRAATALQAQEG